MTDSQSHSATTKHTVVVPASINMVSLLGPGDEHLSLIVQAFSRSSRARSGTQDFGSGKSASGR